MRPKDLRVRGRWTIRLETQNRFGSACRGSSHGIGASCYVSCGARSSSWYRKGVNLSVLKLRKLDALSWPLACALRSVQGLAHLAKSR